MKCGLKGAVNIKLQGGETLKLIDVLYVSQAIKSLLRISSIGAKVYTMGDTKDKMTIKKNGVSMNLNTRKGKK